MVQFDYSELFRKISLQVRRQEFSDLDDVVQGELTASINEAFKENLLYLNQKLQELDGNPDFVPARRYIPTSSDLSITSAKQKIYKQFKELVSKINDNNDTNSWVQCVWEKLLAANKPKGKTPAHPNPQIDPGFRLLELLRRDGLTKMSTKTTMEIVQYLETLKGVELSHWIN